MLSICKMLPDVSEEPVVADSMVCVVKGVLFFLSDQTQPTEAADFPKCG
jgi:hypothetical protein